MRHDPAPLIAAPAAWAPLRLASCNLEIPAPDGTGCERREAGDYEAMRRIAHGLNADVIAFQEAESEAAAAQAFDPKRYDIVMEAHPGAASGRCRGCHSGKALIRRAVRFAISKGLAFDRIPDVTALMLGNPQRRSGVDIILRALGHLHPPARHPA